MENWLENELQNKWNIINSNPKMLHEIFEFAKNNQSISTLNLRNRSEVLILEVMRMKETDTIKRAAIEDALKEIINEEKEIDKNALHIRKR